MARAKGGAVDRSRTSHVRSIMKISYRETWGAKPRPIEGSFVGHDPDWTQFAGYLRHAPEWIRVHAKDQIPLWAPCTFVGGWTTDRIVGGIHAIVFDLDDIDACAVPAVQSAARAITDHGLIHSTWNSETWIGNVLCTSLLGNVLCTSLRVILPLSEPEPIETWTEKYRAIASLFAAKTRAFGAMIELVTGGRGGIDLSCANPARTYYLPATDLRTGRAPSFDQW